MEHKELPDGNVLPDLPPKTYLASYKFIQNIIKDNFSEEDSSFFDKTNWRHVKTGESPLQFAIRKDRPKLAGDLNRLWDMVYSKDCIGNKAIHTAAIYGRVVYIEKLLHKKKKFVNELNDRNETPLHLAIRYGHHKCAELLIKSGASLQAKDCIGDTPIHTAIQYEQQICLKLLLENGSSVFVLNRTNDSPIQAAKDLQCESLIAMLQDYQFQGPITDVASYKAYSNYFEKMSPQACEMGRRKLAVHSVKVSYRRPHCEIKMKNKLFSEITGLGIETKEEFENMLSSGSFRCYWNRSYLVGPYNVGKTTLAKNLVADPIPEERRSTDGIWIYLGRAGMDIDERKWIFVPHGTELNAAVQSMLISSGKQTESEGIKEDRDNIDDHVYNQADNVFINDHADNQKAERKQIPQFTTGADVPSGKTSSTSAALLPDIGNVGMNKCNQPSLLPPVSPIAMETKSKTVSRTDNNILDLVLAACKSGEYKMKLVPIDLWDFGGQKIYYMTHQLFISSRGIYIIIFNGSKDIQKEVTDLSYLPGQYGKRTIAVYLLHWVNSILTYCKSTKAGFPKIMFVATHKDLITKTKLNKHKEKLTVSIEKLFQHHTGRHHLQIRPLFFVNAKDKDDQEVDELRKAIVEVSFSHPRWGEPMPTLCVPLDLQLMEHSKKGQKIMALEEIEEINASNETMVLTQPQLTTFLKLQHALGKYIYFHEGQLSKYVVIDPTYLVEVLKSVVTEEEFWPKKEDIRNIYLSLRDAGVLRKTDLFTLWGQEEYRHVIDYKDYLINMLIHLDILIEPRSNLLDEGEDEDDKKYYYVPCMVKPQAKRPKTKSDLSIYLAYAFKEDVIPPAFMYRFLGTAMSMWSIKAMFTDCAIVFVDRCHDLIVYAEGKRLVIELVHKTSKKNIVATVASTVQECLTRAIIEISKFYWSATDSDPTTASVTTEKKTVPEFACVSADERTGNQQQIIPYSIEFGVKCSSTSCFFQHNLTTENQNYRWKCPQHNKQHDTSDLRLWFAEKSLHFVNKSYGLVCSETCLGLGELELEQCPTDQHIGRLVSGLKLEVVKEVFLHLDMTMQKWDEFQYNYPCSGDYKYFALWEWKQKAKHSTFRALKDALAKVGEDHHKLCEVFRELEIPTGIPEEVLASTPDESLLENLSNSIGNDNLQLGLELGLKGVELQAIAFQHKTRLMEQTREILRRWRKCKQPLSVLAKAFIRIDKFGVFTRCYQT